MKNLNTFELDFIVAPNPDNDRTMVMSSYYMTKRGYRWALLDCDYGIDNVIESLRYANLGDDDDLKAARRWRDLHGSPRLRTVRPSIASAYDAATLCEADMIIAERDGCTLETKGGRFVMKSSNRRHDLAIEHTDLERLKAHWMSFSRSA